VGSESIVQALNTVEHSEEITSVVVSTSTRDVAAAAANDDDEEDVVVSAAAAVEEEETGNTSDEGYRTHSSEQVSKLKLQKI
jgi:hypothetical protein